jgi:hypothetical protein
LNRNTVSAALEAAPLPRALTAENLEEYNEVLRDA